MCISTHALRVSNDNQASYRPSAWYWRKDIREARTKAEVQAMALALVDELEAHKAAIRELGFIPPKTRLSPSEAAAKPHLVQFEHP